MDAACRPAARNAQPTVWASPIQTAPAARPTNAAGAGPRRAGRRAGFRAAAFFAGCRARLFVVPRGDAPRRRLA
ncbi:hypothetical protein MCBG_02461 [Micromonospora sp. M42]|nr:hypothetical protein MCBG_02461 [Micromonospora sp. M42]